MKIILLHGDDIKKSYTRLSKFITEAKRRKWEIVNDKIEETQSLFNTEKLIIFRKYQNFTKDQQKISAKLSGNLVIYHQGNIPAVFTRDIKKQKQVVEEKYQLPFLLWQFLDTFSIKLFQELTKTQPPEMILAMIARRLRDLYWVKVGKPDLNSWQLSKLKKQAQKYEHGNIKKFIADLAKIDVSTKSSKVPLKESLDFLIIKRLS